jgi:UTP--glucose-1-phosphate uridylyltransferase
MLPLVDKPAIQYVVEEAVLAGILDITIITGRGKRSLEDHFDRSVELESALAAGGKDADLAQVVEIAELAHMHYVRQPEARGLGHAVSFARHHVGSEPFVVMLGDDIMTDNATVLKGMVAAHERLGCSVIALKAFPPSQISSYGCVAPGEVTADGLVRIEAIVEKPSAEEAPSNLAVMGRYLFTSTIFEMLEHTPPGKGGEIQLTDAIALLLEREPVYGYVFDQGRYDVGNKLDFLRATVVLAIDRDDLGPASRAYRRLVVGAWSPAAPRT